MQARLKLLQEWSHELRALLPGARATRVATRAACSLGALWAGSVGLLAVAQALPLPAADMSTERRLRRWLANGRVATGELWDPLVPRLLARYAGQEVVLALDPTPHHATATVIVLGLVAHQRVLPLAWEVLPQQAPWPQPQLRSIEQLCRRVQGWLPPGCTVTLVADRGLTSPDLIRLCESLGWHDVLRLSADARQGPRCRLPGRPEGPVWELVRGPGQRWFGAVELFKGAGWVSAHLSIVWQPGHDEPWLLVSDRPAGRARAREYRRRAQAEATFQDGKRRGWRVEQSKVTARDRLHRLLLVLFLALWWAHGLGLRAIRCGIRRRFDRADRRELSVVRLGRRWLHDLLDHERRPPLLLRAAGRPGRRVAVG